MLNDILDNLNKVEKKVITKIWIMQINMRNKQGIRFILIRISCINQIKF